MTGANAATMLKFLLLLVLLSAIPTVNAWGKIDYEIFDLHDSLTATLGKTATFYTAFNVESTATTSEINKAYRKTSLAYHPDKNPDPKAAEFYQILTSIAAILKDSNNRNIYDEHLRRGIPVWRGTGYYYNRYKPGLTTVLTIIAVAISFVQYVSGWIFYYQRRSRINEAKQAFNNLTYAQVKKQLKKSGVVSGDSGGSGESSPVLNKRAFKKATPFELLQATGRVPSEQDLQLPIPSLWDIFVVRLPIVTFQTIIRMPEYIKTWQEEMKQAALQKELKKKEEEEMAATAQREESDATGGNDSEASTASSKRDRRRRRKHVGGAGVGMERTPSSLSTDSVGSDSVAEGVTAGSDAASAVSNPFGVALKRKTAPASKSRSPTKDGDDSTPTDNNGEKEEKAEEGEEEAQEVVDAEEDVPELKEGPWTTDEYSNLAKLMKKYPAGTPGRWVRIANELSRQVDDVANTAKELKDNPRLALGS
ncbi:hypothetical protein HK102_013444 [Quaeritorhiza haematococci]|nr:hypothetical protein HK102_013444 [Quaeritorhiza haematococci]